MAELTVRIERLEPRRMARFHAFGPHPEQDAWARLREWAAPRGLLQDPKTHPVFGFNNPGPSAPDEPYGYEFWLAIKSDTAVESGVETEEFPGGWYAVTTCHGPPNPGTWMRLLHWLRSSPYRHRRIHELEHPRNPLAAEPETDFDLYLPIEQPGSTGDRAGLRRMS